MLGYIMGRVVAVHTPPRVEATRTVHPSRRGVRGPAGTAPPALGTAAPEKLPGLSGSFLRAELGNTNRSKTKTDPHSRIASNMNNMAGETWQKPAWTRAASAEQKAWMAASASAGPSASDETWQRSWARAASVEANAWREATARPRGATAMTETWRRPSWARGASAEANAWNAAMAAAR